jgi:hypothetical protein
MISAHSVEHPEDIADRGRIARNHQGRFWCGFCKEIIVHTKTDQEALDLRFDHIASHFQEEHRNIGQWEELAGNGKTKQELTRDNELIDNGVFRPFLTPNEHAGNHHPPGKAEQIMNPTAFLAKNPDLQSLNPPQIVGDPQTSGILPRRRRRGRFVPSLTQVKANPRDVDRRVVPTVPIGSCRDVNDSKKHKGDFKPGTREGKIYPPSSPFD